MGVRLSPVSAPGRHWPLCHPTPTTEGNRPLSALSHQTVSPSGGARCLPPLPAVTDTQSCGSPGQCEPRLGATAHSKVRAVDSSLVLQPQAPGALLGARRGSGCPGAHSAPNKPARKIQKAVNKCPPSLYQCGLNCIGRQLIK